ncbi:hypothetical protein MKW94_013617 [Papaver nudicaule]|uniref:Ubiquitin-like domain-containing protein n=1 Tax=Papaver nudicaule TaxID=74823 RepID=A0AA41UYR0_PAPNU|nr:hypothetical protein [Papaver nudicaule]
MEVYNVLVNLIDGKTATLKFTTPTISGESIKTHLYKLTKIPQNQQRLLTGTKQIHDETLIKLPNNKDGTFFTINLLGRLLGGKGGFGSLLRGAGTKAGQKKTDNFDACRDMSGRRLRHVNAERKLEEWKAEEEERKLEKVAEDFLKKKGKELKKTGSKGDDKYIEKYRMDSEKCCEGVENAVRDAFKSSVGEAAGKRKKKSFPSTSGNSEKRLKLWSVEEDEDDTDSSDDEKSEVLDEGKSKDGESSSGSGSVENSGGELSSPGGSTETKTGCFEVGQGSGHQDEIDGLLGPELESREDIVSEAEIVHVEENESVGTKSESGNQTVNQSANVSNMEIQNELEIKSVAAEANGSIEETPVASEKNSDLDKPLNFDDYNCAADMEVLGMERLKAELQAHGLKCGGALQERASRLFLLKTTTIDKLPKKVLAKK